MRRLLSSSQAEAWLWTAIATVGYFLLASQSLNATRISGEMAAIWPPSGFCLAVLLLAKPGARWGILAGTSIASFLSNLISGASEGIALAFTLANVTEAAFACWLLARLERGPISFMAPRSVANFCAAAVAASVASASVATTLVTGTAEFFLSWMATVALGIMIVTPPIVILIRLIGAGVIRSVSRTQHFYALSMLLGTAIITFGCFNQGSYPLTFLPAIAVMVVSYRLGPFGAASGLLIITTIASALTERGQGPFAAMDASPEVIVLFLQFYLLVLLFTALPLAALLDHRQRLARRLEQSNRWLLQAEAAAHVGHWRVDLVRRKLRLSDQAYLIHGVEDGADVSGRMVLHLYLEEDREMIGRVLDEAVRTGKPFAFQGRIRRADGQTRDVKCFGSIEQGRTGKPVAIFGSVQDVTDMVQNARILELARNDAERAANTDMLTGLPNRRSTLSMLEDAISHAASTGAALAVAIFDIDHFKQINDRHGHSVGDMVIRRIGLRARATLREEDMVGRYGGEEFVCIMRGVSAVAAETMAERMRRSIEAVPESEDEGPPATVSVGLAVYNGETNLEDLLQRADQALYSAKRAGRNRLRLAA